MSLKILALFVIGVVVVIGAVVYVASPSNAPGQYDDFAKCLTENGAKFYGAFWCSHCNNQKALFGNSVKYVNYIECSTPNRQGQFQVCIDAGIESYPTWKFADGTAITGEVTLQQLAEKTSCALNTTS